MPAGSSEGRFVAEPATASDGHETSRLANWSAASTIATGTLAPQVAAAVVGLTPAVLSFPMDGGATYAALSRYTDGGWTEPVVLDVALEATISALVGSASGDAWGMWRSLDEWSLAFVRLSSDGAVLEKNSVAGLMFSWERPALNPKLVTDGHGGWWLVGIERDADQRLVAMHCP